MPATTPHGRNGWREAGDFRPSRCYDPRMSDVAVKKLSKAEVAELRKLRLEAMNLQEIEGNPLDAEDIAMFEMFEREGWDDDRCRAYILARRCARSKRPRGMPRLLRRMTSARSCLSRKVGSLIPSLFRRTEVPG